MEIRSEDVHVEYRIQFACSKEDRKLIADQFAVWRAQQSTKITWIGDMIEARLSRQEPQWWDGLRVNAGDLCPRFIDMIFTFKSIDAKKLQRQKVKDVAMSVVTACLDELRAVQK